MLFTPLDQNKALSLSLVWLHAAGPAYHKLFSLPLCLCLLFVCLILLFNFLMFIYEVIFYVCMLLSS